LIHHLPNAVIEEKLAESSAANAALISQLESLNPQLSSLEKALSNTKSKLESEASLRRESELAQEEAEATAREAEGTLEKLRAENEEVHEQLAFREEEVEEMRLELEVEKERHSVELEELAAQLVEASKGKSSGNAQKKKDSANADGEEKDNISVMTDDEDFVTLAVGSNDANADDQEDYIKRLEDELEDVTEQLIEAETSISNMEGNLAAAEKKKSDLEKKVAEMETNVEEMQKAAEEAAKTAVAKEDLEGAKAAKEELALLTEELNLTQEELKAAEEDAKAAAASLERAEIAHKAELVKLTKELETAKGSASNVDQEVFTLQKALGVANSETDTLRDEVQNLTQALQNAKSDYEKTMEEMDALRQAFDENEENVRQSSAMREEELVKEHGREIQDLQAELLALQESNKAMKHANKKKSGLSAAEVDLQTKLDSKQKEFDRLKNDLAEERTENTKARRKIEELSAGNRALINGALDAPRKRSDSISQQKNVTFSSFDDVEVEEETNTSDFYRSHARSRQRFPHESGKRARSSSPTTVVRLEREVSSQTKKVKTLAVDCEELKSQKRMSDVRMTHLEKDIEKSRKDVEQAEARSDNLVNVVAAGIANPDTRDDGEDIDGDIEKVLKTGSKEEIEEEVRALSRKASLQKEHNAQLLVKILKLQGNIQVCCRIRPMTNREIKSGTKRVVESLSESDVGVFDSRTNNWKSFSFDKVWGPDSHQMGVFQDVEPLALSVVDGYNACIFAYGQT
jgi:kinesin family protein C2/C3